MTLKATLKRHAPAPVLRAAAWRRDVWGDLRLRLLTSAGRIPSHRARKVIYRNCGMRLPTSSAIHWRAEFYAPERIVIGENVTIGDTCFLDGRSGLSIGDSVNLGSRVHIYTREHDVDSPTFAETGGPVAIGDHAWVASHAIVLPGVTIGQGAVVAAGAVVTKDVEPFTVVGGNPARPIRKRNEDLRYRLGYAKRFV
ncbi:acyltransferase [Janibacter sp. CX7]|uniref:acyltransferase n=1 Tax=Janibacter sp. CX7 TaxID=2963431 RepID=UPI0020CF7836|nr:acyltransferase [Janibacter sp. CX7]UTT65361.1 acyltransferase [Janibacter sp. CX7]